MEDVGVKCPTGLVALAGVLNADPDRPADFGDRIRRDRARHCPAYDTAAIDLDHCGDERHRHARIATLDHRARADLSGVGEADEIGRACVGKECVSTCRSRWSPYHSNKHMITPVDHILCLYYRLIKSIKSSSTY